MRLTDKYKVDYVSIYSSKKELKFDFHLFEARTIQTALIFKKYQHSVYLIKVTCHINKHTYLA